MGNGRYDTTAIKNAFPELLNDLSIEKTDHQSIHSYAYNAEDTYYIKVYKKRHVKVHNLFIKWKNFMAQSSDVSPAFRSYSTPTELAQYEFNALDILTTSPYNTISPVMCDTIDDSVICIYDHMSHTIPQEDDRTMEDFESLSDQLQTLHKNGITHTNITDHIIQTAPQNTPTFTDIIGRTKEDKTSTLTGVGYDIATLLLEFAEKIGIWPAVKTLQEHYSDIELLAACKATQMIKRTTPQNSQWATKHVKATLIEFIDPDIINQTISTKYKDSDNKVYDIDLSTLIDQYPTTTTPIENTKDENTPQGATDTDLSNTKKYNRETLSETDENIRLN